MSENENINQTFCHLCRPIIKAHGIRNICCLIPSQPKRTFNPDELNPSCVKFRRHDNDSTDPDKFNRKRSFDSSTASSPDSAIQLDQLPYLCLRKIFEFFDWQDLLKCRAVCRLFKFYADEAGAKRLIMLCKWKLQRRLIKLKRMNDRFACGSGGGIGKDEELDRLLRLLN